MKSFDPIPFAQPLRDVRIAAPAPAVDPGRRQQDAERDAYERGRHDGETALGEQMLQQRAELLELHQGVIESLRNALPRVAETTEKTLIDLALETAKKIVADMPITSKNVEAVVRDALRQIEDTAEATVLLHPDDLALLHKHKSPLLHGQPETGPLRFMSSAEVTRGGCLIQTRFGLLDARRETKIEQLRQSLAA